MKQFLAGKNVAYAASKTDALTNTALSPDTLAEGAIGVYAKSGTNGKLILVDAAADMLDVKEIFIARGLAAGSILSDAIERKNLKVEKTAAVAAVAKGMDINGIPDDLAAGTLVELVVVNTTPTITTDWKVKRYSYRTIAANEPSSTIIDALIAIVGAHAQAIVITDNADPILAVDAKDAKTNFDAYVEIGETRTIRGTVASEAVRSIGTAAGMKFLQTDADAYQGKTRYIDRTTADLGDSNQVTDGTTYVTYNLGWDGTTRRLGVPVDATAHRFKRLVVAIPTGGAAIASLDAILAPAAMEEVAAQAEEAGA